MTMGMVLLDWKGTHGEATLRRSPIALKNRIMNVWIAEKVLRYILDIASIFLGTVRSLVGAEDIVGTLCPSHLQN